MPKADHSSDALRAVPEVDIHRVMSLLVFPASIVLAVWAFLLRKKPGISPFVRAMPLMVLCLWLSTIVAFGVSLYWLMGTVANVNPADKATVLAAGIAESISTAAFFHVPIVLTLAGVFLFLRWRWARGSRGAESAVVRSGP